MSGNDERSAESRRIIGRMGAESDASMATRVRDHMAGRDADEKDWAELWGTRIGRGLGAVLLIYLVWWIVDFAVRGG